MIFVNYHLQIVVDNDGLLLLGIETLEHLHLSLSVEPAINTIHYNEELLNYNTETGDERVTISHSVKLFVFPGVRRGKAQVLLKYLKRTLSVS